MQTVTLEERLLGGLVDGLVANLSQHIVNVMGMGVTIDDNFYRQMKYAEKISAAIAEVIASVLEHRKTNCDDHLTDQQCCLCGEMRNIIHRLIERLPYTHHQYVNNL